MTGSTKELFSGFQRVMSTLAIGYAAPKNEDNSSEFTRLDLGSPSTLNYPITLRKLPARIQ